MNGITLLRNLNESGLADRVDFFSCALSDAPGVLPFNYVRWPQHRAGANLAIRA